MSRLSRNTYGTRAGEASLDAGVLPQLIHRYERVCESRHTSDIAKYHAAKLAVAIAHHERKITNHGDTVSRSVGGNHMLRARFDIDEIIGHRMAMISTTAIDNEPSSEMHDTAKH